MTNILVTGGAGYIGSHACKLLHQAGFTPVCFDNLVYGHEWAVQWGPLVKGDILDAAALDHAFGTYRPLAVVHFAAYAYVGESVEDPARYYRNNVAGTLSLLEAMLRHRCYKLVFSSTCATYGVPERMPITEDTVQCPINPYGATKWMIERILADFSTAYGLRATALRYFNAAGADADGDIGEDHDPETHLIPRILDVAAGQTPAITVYGNDYDTPDGTCIRDYIHVTDLASAHVLSLQQLLQGGAGAIYNLGTGQGTSVLEMIDCAESVTGRRIPIDYQPRRPGDPARLVAAADKAYSELHWQPQYSKPQRIIETAWRWHQSHHCRKD
ncbi:MAG: UDP-glucose 4-epimerase GalE [Stenotrophobium sp.]